MILQKRAAVFVAICLLVSLAIVGAGFSLDLQFLELFGVIASVFFILVLVIQLLDLIDYGHQVYENLRRIHPKRIIYELSEW